MRLKNGAFQENKLIAFDRHYCQLPHFGRILWKVIEKLIVKMHIIHMINPVLTLPDSENQELLDKMNFT